MALSRFLRVEQIVVTNFSRGKSIDNLNVPDRFGKRSEQKRDARQTLLPIDYQQRRLMGYLRQSSLDVDDRPDKMHRYCVVAAGADDVIPELAAFLGGPGIRALIYWDHKLGRFF